MSSEIACHSEVATLERLRGGDSIARFGDGEFMIALGRSLSYQTSTPAIRARLLHVLDTPSSDDRRLLIGIPRVFRDADLEDLTPRQRAYWSQNLSRWRHLLRAERQYASSFISRPDQFHDDAESATRRAATRATVSWMWTERETVLVASQLPGKFASVLDDPASRVMDSLDVPVADAFAVYDDIVAWCRSFPIDTRILLSAGCTATIAAFDLSALGYQALDIGALHRFV